MMYYLHYYITKIQSKISCSMAQNTFLALINHLEKYSTGQQLLLYIYLRIVPIDNLDVFDYTIMLNLG